MGLLPTALLGAVLEPRNGGRQDPRSPSGGEGQPATVSTGAELRLATQAGHMPAETCTLEAVMRNDGLERVPTKQATGPSQLATDRPDFSIDALQRAAWRGEPQSPPGR